MSREQLLDALSSHGIAPDHNDPIVKILLWFGFIGIIRTDNSFRYIDSFHYNMNVLNGTHNQLLASGKAQYVISPAFAPAFGPTYDRQGDTGSPGGRPIKAEAGTRGRARVCHRSGQSASLCQKDADLGDHLPVAYVVVMQPPTPTSPPDLPPTSAYTASASVRACGP